MGSMIYTKQSSGKKKPRKKTQSIIAAEKALQETLARCGYKGTKRVASKLKIDPIVRHSVPTSDAIPANGNRRASNKYTGNEIAGVVLNHKQAYEPVRRDNKEAAVNASQMRRN